MKFLYKTEKENRNFYIKKIKNPKHSLKTMRPGAPDKKPSPKNQFILPPI